MIGWRALASASLVMGIALCAPAGCSSPDPLPAPDPWKYLESIQTTIGGEPASVTVYSADGGTTFPVQIGSSWALVSFCVGERPAVRVQADRVEIGRHVLEFTNQGATLRHDDSVYELARGGAYLFGHSSSREGVFLGRVR